LSLWYVGEQISKENTIGFSMSKKKVKISNMQIQCTKEKKAKIFWKKKEGQMKKQTIEGQK
jgi:hypothetical protein